MSRPHCSECPTATYHRSGKCKPCRQSKGTTMTKYATLIVLALNLTACGNTHYEYFVGKDGAQGEKGDAGTPGAPGIDATSVTVVKLCPGVTVYPSKFIEVLFCIGGTFYGTYSAKGGFSSEIPPGAYFSNGINASCNATVGPNCTVSN